MTALFSTDNFLRRRFQIEISVAHLLIDPGPQVFQPLFFALLEKRRPEEHLRVLFHPEK